MSAPAKRPRLASSSKGQIEDERETSRESSSEEEPQDPVKVAQAFWRQRVLDWYPNLHTTTYFVPPLHFNRVPYDEQVVAGRLILVPHEASDQPIHQSGNATGGPRLDVLDCHVRDDRAQQRVLHYVRGVADREQEVMVVLSQLEFRQYLDKQMDPITAAATAAAFLPRPNTLGPAHRRGDFDVLIIHRRYGLIVGEIKSVGDNASKTPDLNEAVVTRVHKAVKQLEKSETVLKHLVSDLAFVRVTKTLMLPSITSVQLLQALSTNGTVQEEVCRCLGTTDVAEAVSRCLCSDDLASSDWWQRSVARNGDDVAMTQPTVYETIVARFCGPATTIEVPCVTRSRVEMRTLSQAIAHTGLRMTRLTLHPQQVALVNRPNLLKVYITGPPGTGKTIILIIKGLQWLHQGLDVHVLSPHRASRAAAFLIYHELLHALNAGSTATAAAGPRVYLHLYDFQNKQKDVEDALNTLATAARDGILHVLADEALEAVSQRFDGFIIGLVARVPNLRLWAASVMGAVVPKCLSREHVTIPVRSPPAVLREVMQSELIDDMYVPRYTSSPIPPPTDGPPVRWFRHKGRPGHTDGEPAANCERCGEVIAELLDELRICSSGPGDLQYRDVLILYIYPREDLGMVRALRARKVPLRVVTGTPPDDDLRDLALAVRDEVVLTSQDVVGGLERRVVIGLDCTADVDVFERLRSMSRSTAQLMWVDFPGHDDRDKSGEDEGDSGNGDADEDQWL